VRGLLVLAAAAALLFGGADASAGGPDPEIGGLQLVLQARGLYKGRVDGVAGPATQAAIRVLQRAHGLAPTGRIDRRTLALLGPLGRPAYASRPLKRGMVGLDVAALQFELRLHGFGAAGDGGFGPVTQRLVREFQKSAHLKPDGIAGHATYEALARPLPAAEPAVHLRSPLPVAARAVAKDGAVELFCPYATPVADVVPGTVLFAGNRDGGYGYTVVVERADGLRLLYGHLARVDVRKGQRVVPGALVGLAGWTGKAADAPTSLRIELAFKGRQLDALRALAATAPARGKQQPSKP
jgi:hypothetical protein